MDYRNRAKRYIISGLSVLAAALMSSATVHAASNPGVPCDQVGRDLQSLEVPVDTLPVNVVDHTPIDPASLDEALVETDSATPVLDLSPRVTNIFRDIFGTTDEDPGTESPSQPASSPLADIDEESDDTEQADVEFEKRNLPRFQQRMFRTDI